jgi:hypothetical protein
MTAGLGGSAAVGAVWDDSRLADTDEPAELPRLALRVRPLSDGSGWHCSVLDVAGKTEIGRLAYCPGADAAGTRGRIFLPPGALQERTRSARSRHPLLAGRAGLSQSESGERTLVWPLARGPVPR